MTYIRTHTVVKNLIHVYLPAIRCGCRLARTGNATVRVALRWRIWGRPAQHTEVCVSVSPSSLRYLHVRSLSMIGSWRLNSVSIPLPRSGEEPLALPGPITNADGHGCHLSPRQEPHGEHPMMHSGSAIGYLARVHGSPTRPWTRFHAILRSTWDSGAEL